MPALCPNSSVTDRGQEELTGGLAATSTTIDALWETVRLQMHVIISLVRTPDEFPLSPDKFNFGIGGGLYGLNICESALSLGGHKPNNRPSTIFSGTCLHILVAKSMEPT